MVPLSAGWRSAWEGLLVWCELQMATSFQFKHPSHIEQSVLSAHSDWMGEALGFMNQNRSGEPTKGNRVVTEMAHHYKS